MEKQTIKLILQIFYIVVLVLIFINKMMKDNQDSEKLSSPPKTEKSIPDLIPEHKMKKKLNKEQLEEILKEILTNPNTWSTEKKKFRISQIIADKYPFNSNELDLLFSTLTDSYGPGHHPFAFLFAKLGQVFSMETLLKYGNPSGIGGWTLAHEMAMQKHRFSVEDLILLGNPSDSQNQTISDIMKLTGYIFSDEEKCRLGIDSENYDYTACAIFSEREKITMYEPLTDTCIMCGGKLSIMNLSDLRDEYWSAPVRECSVKLHICNKCHWWVVRQYWFEWDTLAAQSWYLSLLYVGVEKPIKPGACREQEPWKKFLFNEDLYRYALPITDEIQKLFPKSSWIWEDVPKEKEP